MAVIQIILVALAIFQVALSAPEGYNQSNRNQLDDIVEHVKSTYHDVLKLLEKHFPNTTKVAEQFAEQARSFTKNVDSLIESLKVKIGKNQDRLNEVFSKVSEQLSEHIAGLKTVIGPNAAAEVEQVKSKLESSFKTVYKGVNNIMEAAKPEHIYSTTGKAFKFSQEVAEKFLNIAKVLQTSLETTFKETGRMIF